MPLGDVFATCVLLCLPQIMSCWGYKGHFTCLVVLFLGVQGVMGAHICYCASGAYLWCRICTILEPAVYVIVVPGTEFLVVWNWDCGFVCLKDRSRELGLRTCQIMGLWSLLLNSSDQESSVGLEMGRKHPRLK